jgi:hypothetical protein
VTYHPWFSSNFNISVASTSPQVNISNLARGVPYVLYISVTSPSTTNIADYVCHARVSGPYNASTAISQPSVAIAVESAAAVNRSHIRVIWQAIGPMTWGDGMIGYRVEYTRVAGQERADLSLPGMGSVSTTMSSDTESLKSIDVAVPQVHIDYRIGVVAVNRAGAGPQALGGSSFATRTLEGGL